MGRVFDKRRLSIGSAGMVGLLVLTVGMCAAQVGAKPAVEFPGYRVEVALSEKAMANLTARKETVVVAGYLEGMPRAEAPRKDRAKSGEVGLGTIHGEAGPGKVVIFGETKIKAKLRAQVDGHSPRLLINVYSGRKSSRNNLLDCGIFEGTLESVQGTTVPISCKLIGE